jgi:Na+-translocating ferredoxin:NAD+ oxidoreductase RNF subunit RnfB
MGGIGLFFSLLIALANKKLHVEEDPKIGQIAECLPGANCGSCGYAGCNNFAEALAGGKSQISGCPVCSPSAREEIARILGGCRNRERRVAVVFCQVATASPLRKPNTAALKPAMRLIW